MKEKLSKPAAERLVQLERLLEQLELKKDVNEKLSITSLELEQLTGWKRDTIRRDISFLKSDCSTVSGYDVSALRKAIRQELCMNESEKRCCLVGLGRLGESLLNYDGFKKSNFTLVAGFDTNVNRTEILKSPFPLFATTRMEEIVKKEMIQFALLAVPAKSAQAAADKLVACGIEGIVNFTSAVLSVPENVIIENVSIIDALQKIAARKLLKK